MISSIIREFTKEEKEQLAEEQRPEVTYSHHLLLCS